MPALACITVSVLRFVATPAVLVLLAAVLADTLVWTPASVLRLVAMAAVLALLSAALAVTMG
jgi:hypothetical protein